jgi:hypothetical protein
MPFPPTNAEAQARVRAFREELRKRGWAIGVNAQFDERWTGDNMDFSLISPSQYKLGGEALNTIRDEKEV